jgi:subfamily B ATP-binding cassette protein MsbA
VTAFSEEDRALQTPGTSADEGQPRSPGRFGDLGRLWEFVQPHWRLLLLGMALLGATGGTNVWLYSLLDDLLRPIREAAQQGGPAVAQLWARVWAALALVLAVGVAKGVLYYASHLAMAVVAKRAIIHLRRRMFEHLQFLPLTFFEDRRTGAIISNVLADTVLVRNIMANDMGTVIVAPVTIIGALVAMLLVNWQLALTTLVLLPLIAVGIYLAGRRIKQATAEAQERLGAVASVVEETLAGIRVIRLFGMERAQAAKFARENEANAEANLQAEKVRALLVPLIELISIAGFGLAILVGAYQAFHGRLQLEELVNLLFYAQLIGTNANALFRLNSTLQQGAAAAERLFTVLDAPPAVGDRQDARELKDMVGELALDDVSFAYDGAEVVLDEVSFAVGAGETVALVGPSGAGKTTVANLIPRLYEPQTGAVRIDGEDVRGYTLTSVRRHIALVPQETLLFSGTIRENILFGNPDATEEQVRQAAKAAYADEFIERLPDGYDTMVGERGVKLSGGQKQRIAIARALLRDPKILILDEATSSLDSESEALVQAALANLLKGRTALVIAHRLSTIRDATRIVVISNGRVVEEGTHAELMAEGGVYSKLYRTQLAAGEAA